jgi:hypothetical protein
MPRRIIHLHPQAPALPAAGAACNGCGVCCALEPCPLGILVTRARSGRCAALQWDDAQQRYQCAWIASPARVTRLEGTWLNRGVAALATRWIAAGQGCDAAVQVEPDQGHG